MDERIKEHLKRLNQYYLKLIASQSAAGLPSLCAASMKRTLP
jgi:hypothetical protein